MSPLRGMGIRSLPIRQQNAEKFGSAGVYEAIVRNSFNVDGRRVQKVELEAVVRQFAARANAKAKRPEVSVRDQAHALIAARNRERNLRLAELE